MTREVNTFATARIKKEPVMRCFINGIGVTLNFALQDAVAESSCSFTEERVFRLRYRFGGPVEQGYGHRKEME